MKILYISQYFIPEVEPSASKVFELSKEFVEQGHEVVVITGFPNYPSGRLYPNYRLRSFTTEFLHGIKVIRVLMVPSASDNYARRVIGHISFMFSALVTGIFIKKPDVVICSSPPLEIAVTGLLVSKIKRAKFVFEVRDLWPDDAIQLGIVKNSILSQALVWIEKFIYRQADLIVPVSEGFVEYILASGAKKEKIKVILNGTDINLFHPRETKEQFFVKDRFICLYLGTQGLQNNLIPLMDAIKNIEERYPKIKFLFVGNGREKQKHIQYCYQNRIKNIEFLPPVSRDVAADYVRNSDICLLHTKKIDINKRHVPAKIYDYLAGGCSVVAGISGEGRKMIEESGAGICTEPEDSVALQKAIVELFESKDLREKYGASGRRYAEENFSREKIAEQYLKVLISLNHNGNGNNRF